MIYEWLSPLHSVGVLFAIRMSPLPNGLSQSVVCVVLVTVLLSVDVNQVAAARLENKDVPEQVQTIGFQRVKETFYGRDDRSQDPWLNDTSLEIFDEDNFNHTDESLRFINPANPFGLFGTPTCEFDGHQGTCYEGFQCLVLGGRVGPVCERLRGTCCRFFRTCGERSSQEIIYFSNNKYGGLIQPPIPQECNLQFIKGPQQYCGIRVEPSVDPKLIPPSSQSFGGSKCLDAVLSISGLGDRLELNLCNQKDAFQKKKYDFDISNAGGLKFKITSLRKDGSPVDVTIRQLRCSEFTGEDLTGTLISGGGGATTTVGGGVGGGTTGVGTTGGTTTGGGSSGVGSSGAGTTSGGVTPTVGGVLPPAPPVPVVVPTPGPPSPPPLGTNFAACGIKGSGRRARQEPHPSSERFEIRAEGPPIHSFRESRQDPLPSWDPPTNNETIFSYLMGEPNIVGTRITNGLETNPHEFPWQVAIFKSGNKFHCGASIIGDFYVLTAAHCVMSFVNQPQSLVLRLGEWSLSSSSGGSHVDAQVDTIRVHPDYSRTNLQNDIAVLKLKRRIEFNEAIRPVCLPRADTSLTGETATVTGWGKNELGSLVDKMNKLTTSVIDNDDCSSRWGGSGFIKPSMLCMSSQIGDSCNGDSGGPSVIEIPPNSGKYHQVGIVSFGSGSCTDKKLPGVYTRVAFYRDWILRQMI